MKENISIPRLFDLEKTIAAELFRGKNYPWEVLDGIKDFILQKGKTLDPEEFDHPEEGIWIAKDAVVAPTALIKAPCIIDSGAEIRHCAFIRGSAVVGKKAVVGNSTELKNVILFDGVQVSHFNYVGDSVLGYKAHMGAGSVTSNVKSDKTNVAIKGSGEEILTGRRKLGAMLGDLCEVGCNAVLCPGTILGRSVTVYPTSCVRGYIPEEHIYKSAGNVVKKRSGN